MKKKLNVSEEEFFTLCALHYGKPDSLAKSYVYSKHNFERGVPAYLKYSRRGYMFLECVTMCGEAKLRAGRWYYRYSRWYRKHHQEIY